jgi:hypothetical protein
MTLPPGASSTAGAWARARLCTGARERRPPHLGLHLRQPPVPETHLAIDRRVTQTLLSIFYMENHQWNMLDGA